MAEKTYERQKSVLSITQRYNWFHQLYKLLQMKQKFRVILFRYQLISVTEQACKQTSTRTGKHRTSETSTTLPSRLTSSKKLWKLKWWSLLTTYSWEKLKQTRLVKVRSSHGEYVLNITSSRYLFSLWDVNEKCIDRFIEQAYKFHTTAKFTAKVPEKENHIAVRGMYTVVCKVEWSQKGCYPLLQADLICLSI